MKIFVRFNIPLLILLLAMGCKQATKNEGEQQGKDAVQKAIEWVNPELDRPKYEVQLPGELKPYESVDIYAKVKGFIRKIYVDRGDAVKKGQLLATLEAPELNHQYGSDKANQEKLYAQYLFSKQSYDRLLQASDKKNGSISAIELDKAKSLMLSDSAAYTSSKSITSRASQLQDYLRITAPFDGIIMAKNVSEGALVGENSQQPLFSLAQNTKLRLSVAVPEVYSNSVYTGLEADFSVLAYPDRKFKAVLSRNASIIDDRDRSLALEFDVINNASEMRGGDYAEVSIPFQRKEATWWLPASAIMQTQSGTFVISVNDEGVANRIPVKVGVRQTEKTEVFGHLNETSRIIKQASEEIIEGEKVNNLKK
ncbi:efflux RND transporter periplasmic adaptor subunit [Pseudopedobacter beijingensis]|uniref:Efflux RND transporter periplasmic adaptor subunit n=1 Tax=Pseudopedobacter beijingensis TaxID=1207056 RepID=A0ABW4ID48_9SPHI